MRSFAKAGFFLSCALHSVSGLGCSEARGNEGPSPGELAPTALADIEIEEEPKADPLAPTALEDIELQPEEDGPARKADTGRPLGSFRLTYYWIATEGKGKRTKTLYSKRCKPIAKVSRRFAKRLRMEGSGQLADGRLITTAGGCRCTKSCYFVAGEKYRWGAGVSQRPLSPFRSIAVDTSHVSIGQTLYVPELDGLTMPGVAPYGGFVHDGCVIADDKGGGVRGRKIDFFAARKGHYKALFKRHGIKRITAYDGGGRCKSLAKGRGSTGRAASRGSI
jgi:3D (Asp-Asp-Asp) domain-containing protein